MTLEQIDWIFAQTPERLNLYKQRVRDSYRPSYAKWGKEMGNSAWMQVMQGLCVSAEIGVYPHEVRVARSEEHS